MLLAGYESGLVLGGSWPDGPTDKSGVTSRRDNIRQNIDILDPTRLYIINSIVQDAVLRIQRPVEVLLCHDLPGVKTGALRLYLRSNQNTTSRKY